MSAGSELGDVDGELLVRHLRCDASLGHGVYESLPARGEHLQPLAPAARLAEDLREVRPAGQDLEIDVLRTSSRNPDACEGRSKRVLSTGF